jgi:hypothetical protein
VSFGRPLEGDLEPLARAEPVDIDLGGGLTFRIAGRIDRIDKVGASFEVIDYKTGGFWRDSWKGTFDGGRRLQHALYGLAAVALLRSKYKDPKVVAGVLLSSHKGAAGAQTIPAPQRRRSPACSAIFASWIVQGGFVRTPDADDCRFCDVRRRRGGPSTTRPGKLQVPGERARGSLMFDPARSSRVAPPCPSAKSRDEYPRRGRRRIGKTQMLAKRMAAGVARVQQIEQLAAVTFRARRPRSCAAVSSALEAQARG